MKRSSGRSAVDLVTGFVAETLHPAIPVELLLGRHRLVAREKHVDDALGVTRRLTPPWRRAAAHHAGPSPNLRTIRDVDGLAELAWQWGKLHLLLPRRYWLFLMMKR